MTNGLIARPEHMALTSRTHTHVGQDPQPAAKHIRERSRGNFCIAFDLGFCPEIVFYQIFVICALCFVITSFSARLVLCKDQNPAGRSDVKSSICISSQPGCRSLLHALNRSVPWLIPLRGTDHLARVIAKCHHGKHRCPKECGIPDEWE